jgi:flagellar motor protein MotB
MSSKIFAVTLALAVFGSVGCAGIFVPKEQYDRDLAHIREHNASLERDNNELHAKADALDRLKAEGAGADSGQAYAEMAEALKKALAGIPGIERGDVSIGDKGQTIFATDMLFDSASWEISAKGKEVLKKWAQANKGSQLRIVGFTDKRPVVSTGLKAKLDTDTNMELSANRALAVMNEFIKAGIAERSMWVEGRGSAEPRGTDKDSRRVEVFTVGSSPVAPIKHTGTTKTSHK